MNGDPTFGEALSQIAWFIGELIFRFIPGTFISVTGIGSEPPIPAGLTSFGKPVTTESIISYLEQSSSPEQYANLVYAWDYFVAVSMAVSLALATLVIYCFIRIRQLRYQEHMRMDAGAHTVAAKDIPRTILRWDRIREQASSENAQNWRLAILEADIMLSELLDMKGYKGETIAEKLKQVDRADFHSIDDAWEAHRVRNRVVHQGAEVPLAGRDVQLAISRYERVFREFGLIE